MHLSAIPIYWLGSPTPKDLELESKSFFFTRRIDGKINWWPRSKNVYEKQTSIYGVQHLIFFRTLKNLNASLMENQPDLVMEISSPWLIPGSKTLSAVICQQIPEYFPPLPKTSNFKDFCQIPLSSLELPRKLFRQIQNRHENRMNEIGIEDSWLGSSKSIDARLHNNLSKDKCPLFLLR